MNEDRDYLTGVLNRNGLSESYGKMDKNSSIDVMFMDIDNFKSVNDMYGHEKGDETLIEFAKILTANAPDNSLVVRLGGDEFVVMIQGDFAKTEIANIAENIQADVKRLKSKHRAFEVISVSIGIVQGYKVSGGLDGALNLSDKAMYFAKEQGKDKYLFYDEFENIISYENDIERSAVKALDEGQFVIKYHPLVHMESGRLLCAEACCVWERKDGSFLGRNDYRPVFLKSGFINTLDFYVFRQACKDMAVIRSKSKIPHRIGVQFSYFLLVDQENVKQLMDIIEEYHVSASDFELNFDEHVFDARTATDKVINGMNTLKSMGFNIALSRFGEDFSSARYLRKLPLTAVKVDGDFISDNINSEEGLRILKTIVKLGQGFKMQVCGCKADDSKTMAILAECGFNVATGDCFSGKLSLEEYLAFLNKMDAESKGTVSYRFKGNLSSKEGLVDGHIVGEEVNFEKGISDEWGAMSFPGGPTRTNLVKVPGVAFGDTGYTFSFWIKPLELQNWVSSLYVRCKNGFFSFMPNVAGGRCMFRIKGDTPIDEWHDVMAGGIRVGEWTHVCCSYDNLTSIGRIYINGEQDAMATDMPDIGGPMEAFLGGDVFQMSFHGLISALQINKETFDSEAIKARYEAFLKEPGFVGNEKGEGTVLSEIVVHDPAIYEDLKDKHFYIYGTEAQGFSSRDMLHWKPLGKVVPKVPKEAKEWTGSDAIWAPDIVKVGNEYRLYCSNSSWGVSRSCIFLAVSDKPKGPFVPKGIVTKTDYEDGVNAIDANIIEDHETGEQYMVYGSFWTGIYMLPLDKTTGFAKEGSGHGTWIATRPSWTSGSIEGPYIIYHPETEYYYLFASYGSLKADYNIRVGRSKNITGPYLDYKGRDMVAVEDDDCSIGLMIDCGYRYLNGQAYMAPGHNSVLLRENGEMFLVSHIRKLSFNDNPGPGLLQIRKLIMTPDGWPIAMGQPYNAETLLTVRDELICGEYERIELRPSIPQGISHAHPMTLFEDGRLEMASVVGTWERVDEFSLALEYGPVKEYVHFEKGLDKERNKTSVVMCGLTSDGICTWATKKELNYQSLST